jgi:hypothetical protein
LWRRADDVVARWLADGLEGSACLVGRAGIEDEVTEAAETGATTLPAQAAQRAIERRQPCPALQPFPEPLPSLPAPGRAYKPALAHEVMPRACHECGRALAPAKAGSAKAPRKFCSASCAGICRAEMRRLVPLEGRSIEIAGICAIETARSDKLRRIATERQAWGEAHKDEAEAEASRRWYIAEVVPRLAEVPRTQILRAIGVSRVYARDIARGKVPHPRHFAALARLAGIEMHADRKNSSPYCRSVFGNHEINLPAPQPEHTACDTTCCV